MRDGGERNFTRGAFPFVGCEASPEKAFEIFWPAMKAACRAMEDIDGLWIATHRAKVITKRRATAAEGESARIRRVAEGERFRLVVLCGLDALARLFQRDPKRRSRWTERWPRSPENHGKEGNRRDDEGDLPRH